MQTLRMKALGKKIPFEEPKIDSPLGSEFRKRASGGPVEASLEVETNAVEGRFLEASPGTSRGAF
jgi:hypothetical protein